MYLKNVLETIGNTPLIQLNKLNKGIDAKVLVKVESFNPGHSIKDRMALRMIEKAEASGMLSAGGTIIESTSGNTGMSLAIVGIVKDYRCIFTVPDKLSSEKLNCLKAMGAEVIVCPSNVSSTHKDSYYSVAAQLNKEIPNSFYVNQYYNLSNREAHYETTGPEIWKQTAGKITHFIATVGTGGSISGTAKYLKEQNPAVKIIGVDAYGSVLKKYHETGELDPNEIYPYKLEGVGKNIIPDNVQFDIIDQFVKVHDKDAALCARALTRQEALFTGYSGGAAIQGLFEIQNELKADDLVVVLLHDHGSRYLGKVYDDAWMKENEFLNTCETKLS